MTLIGWGCSPARFRVSYESAVDGLAAWRLDGMLCIKSIKCYFKWMILYLFDLNKTLAYLIYLFGNLFDLI